MNEEQKVIRCPQCGSTALKATYKTSRYSKDEWNRIRRMGPLKGLYYLYKKPVQGTLYWECSRCGHVFPDNEF